MNDIRDKQPVSDKDSKAPTKPNTETKQSDSAEELTVLLDKKKGVSVFPSTNDEHQEAKQPELLKGDTTSQDQKVDTFASRTADNHSKPSEEYKRNLSIISLQFIGVLTMIGMAALYGSFHNVPTPINYTMSGFDMEIFIEAIRNYNFVGVGPDHPEPTLYAVMLEVFILSGAGVLARSQYNLTRVLLQGKKFNTLEAIGKIIGEFAMGVSIAIGVVAFLRSTEFVNLTLRTASIGSIVAISFILGFYHEDTRRLLGTFQKRISGSASENKESEKEE